MTNEKFIEEIIELYRIAKNSTLRFQNDNIKRGRNHSISSQTEDLLAFFILKRCNLKNCEIWVDYPISFKTKSKKTKKGADGTKTIYPDISLARKTNENTFEIYEMIDLKMDLGWKRDLKSYLNEKYNLVNEIRNVKKASYKKIDSNGNKIGDNVEILIAENIKWRVPVISDQNIKAQQMELNITHSKQAKFENFIKMYTFTHERHPNSGNAIIDNSEIDLFVNDIIS